MCPNEATRAAKTQQMQPRPLFFYVPCFFSAAGKTGLAQNMSSDDMNETTDNKPTSQRYPCHCCNKQNAVYWSEKRKNFICENCLKTFHQDIIAKRNGMAVEQLSLC